MAEGRGRHDWDQTSLLWCVLANTARDPEKAPDPFLPSAVHPYRSEEEYQTEEQTIESFGAQFMRQGDG